MHAFSHMNSQACMYTTRTSQHNVEQKGQATHILEPDVDPPAALHTHTTQDQLNQYVEQSVSQSVSGPLHISHHCTLMHACSHMNSQACMYTTRTSKHNVEQKGQATHTLEPDVDPPAALHTHTQHHQQVSHSVSQSLSE